jgi:hypothetical protein
VRRVRRLVLRRVAAGDATFGERASLCDDANDWRRDVTCSGGDACPVTPPPPELGACFDCLAQICWGESLGQLECAELGVEAVWELNGSCAALEASQCPADELGACCLGDGENDSFPAAPLTCENRPRNQCLRTNGWRKGSCEDSVDKCLVPENLPQNTCSCAACDRCFYDGLPWIYEPPSQGNGVNINLGGGDNCVFVDDGNPNPWQCVERLNAGGNSEGYGGGDW